MKLNYNMKIHTIILTIISCFLFTIFIISSEYLSDDASYKIFILGMIVYSLFILFNFIVHKNSFYGFSTFVLAFLFCYHKGNVLQMLSSWSVIIIFSLLGFILHAYIYKPKLYLGHFTPSSLIFLFSIAISGLGVKEYDPQFSVSNPWYFFFIFFIFGSILLIIFNYFECSNESNMYDLTTYFKSYIVLIGYELVLVYIFMCDCNFDTYMHTKAILGIVNNNAFAIVLQMVLPFMLYYSFKKDYLINTIFFYLGMFVLFFTVSRGAIVVTFPLMIFYMIYLCIKNRNKIEVNLVCHVSVLTIIFLTVLIMLFKDFSGMKNYMNRIFGDITNSSGRNMLYEYVFKHVKYNLFFGIGLYSNFSWHLNTDFFQYAHSTFLQTLFMAGIFGVVCLVIHLIDKYFYVIKNKNYLSLMMMFYITPGLYGLIDVTYYSLYTIYLFFVIYFYSSIINVKKKIDYNYMLGKFDNNFNWRF